MSVLNIAIDGPAGAGKSTIAKMLAERLSYIYVDTGAMYRAIGYYVFNNSGLNIDLSKEVENEDLNNIYAFISKNLTKISIDIEYKDQIQQIILNGENITDHIRSMEMGKMASIVSANKEVRGYLVELQQQLATKVPVVMDGRDIGTHVLPNAKLKVYLTASSKIRAKRRFEQLLELGDTPNLAELTKEIEERDYRDMNREHAPLRQAEDAIIIDSSHMTIEEVVTRIYSLVKKIE